MTVDDRPLGAGLETVRREGGLRLHTLILTKGSDGLNCFASSITRPRIIGTGVRLAPNTDRYVVLAFDRAAIKDKKWCSIIGLPSVQLLVDILVDSHRATQSSKERFGFEEACKKVVGIDSSSVFLQLRKVGGAKIHHPMSVSGMRKEEHETTNTRDWEMKMSSFLVRPAMVNDGGTRAQDPYY